MASRWRRDLSHSAGAVGPRRHRAKAVPYQAFTLNSITLVVASPDFGMSGTRGKILFAIIGGTLPGVTTHLPDFRVREILTGRGRSGVSETNKQDREERDDDKKTYPNLATLGFHVAGLTSEAVSVNPSLTNYCRTRPDVDLSLLSRASSAANNRK
jgi:hypothetical protein